MHINEYKNIHEGERCFIICNGPSLNKHDLSKLKDEITIGCNRIYLKKDFAPKYYTIEDFTDIKQFNKDIDNYDRPERKFIPIKSSFNFSDKTNITTIRLTKKIKGPLGDYRFGFNDGNKPLFYWGGTVTYVMLQLAHWMGCNPIYIIGADNDWGDYSEKRGQIKSSSDDKHHFSKDYYGEEKVWNLPVVNRMNRCFEYASGYLDANSVDIYNATKGGKLEIFDRIDYDTLFN